jgi:predicted dehydrogenase
MKRDSTKIGVGIIGASPNRGWALAAHVPALKALPDYEIRAVSTSRRESAEKSAQALGVALAFDNHADLIARPEIDLVLVAVQVAHHNELAKTALTAGKMVYCEWPLGSNLKESEEIASLAQQKGLKTVIGLQGRFAPAVMYLRDLVADGYVGKLLGTHVVGSSPDAWGGTVEAAIASLADVRNGATLLAIPVQFARDLVEGTTLAPDFDAAVERHRLIDAIERSNTTGLRQTL